MKASVDAVASYLRALEDAKIIYAAPRYDIKGKKIMQRLDKHYLVDLGLRYADIGYRTNDIAQILENVVFMELVSRGYKVFVGKEGDREVDFIAEKGDERIYYQVCYLLATVEVKDREYRSLLAIKDAYPKVVLSMDTIHMGTNNGIKHMNIIDFLLGKYM
jgi:predicted AAA+ superfamily ATPase